MENQHTIKNTLDFVEKLKDRTADEDKIIVSYDNFLFTEIPLIETNNHIFDQIFEHKLPQIASWSVNC